MNADQELKERLTDALGDLPLDVERRLDAARTGTHGERTPRVLVYAVAAAVALLAVFALWRLLPLGDRMPTAPAGPTGTIAFTLSEDSSPKDDPDILALDLATGSVTPIVTGVGSAWDASFSPDGSRVVFFRQGSTGYDLVGMNVDGSDQHVVATDAVVYGAAWAPDSNRLAFQSADYTLEKASIHIVDFDGGNERTLVNGAWSNLAWSPDGSALAAIKTETANNDLYVLPASGDGEPMALTHDQAVDGFPSWSSDGSRIVFMRDEEIPHDLANAYDIYTVPATGGQLTKLTDWRGLDAAPVFSPDGRWIAFVSDREATAEQVQTNADGGGIVGGSVFVMAADGTNVRLVYRTDVIAVPSSWAGHVVGPLATPVPELTPAMVAPGPGLATDEASSSNTSGGSATAPAVTPHADASG